jgi:hypothetical protein
MAPVCVEASPCRSHIRNLADHQTPLEQAMAGDATFLDNQKVLLTRKGYEAEAYSPSSLM